MLVNLKEILKHALEKKYIIPGFNVFGYEDAAAVVRAAEQINAPVILMTNKDAIKHMPAEYLGSLLCKIAKNAKVPVCIHLDHAKDYKQIAEAIMSGYTSVMYDGSQLTLDQNIRNTREVVKLAHGCNVTVEAEVGSVGYNDPSIEAIEAFTEPEDARRFVEETNVDALAVAVGTLHRMQIQEAKIQYDRLAAIQDKIKIPLVIHGSTGIRDEDLSKLADYSVAKVNIGTALRMAFGHTLRQEIINNSNEFDRIKLFKKPMKAVEEEVLGKYKALNQCFYEFK